jgi:hypothetical protein
MAVTHHSINAFWHISTDGLPEHEGLGQELCSRLNAENTISISISEPGAID